MKPGRSLSTSKPGRLLGLLLVAVLSACMLMLAAGPVGAEDREPEDSYNAQERVRVGTESDNNTATGDVTDIVPGTPGDDDSSFLGDTGEPQPNCTRSDGTPDFLNYEGLQWTTIDEQRNEIRPEEQRPGVYLHTYCGDEWVEFGFFPEEEGQPSVDPRTLADSVTISPAAPSLVTNPAEGKHLVGLDAWFWAENWSGTEGSATAGSVSVTVSATPQTLIIDPGDGSAPFTCAGPQTAYQPSLPASAQSSDCTHTYNRAGHYTATAAIVYDVSFTSNIGVSGDLGTLRPSSSTQLSVNEGQAVVTG